MADPRTIRIEASAGVPIARQIIEQIRAQCASGVLGGGDRLPSVRELARELAINQNTVLRAYERLTSEGLLERRHGDGTYVVDRPPAGQLKAQRQILRDEISRLVRRALTLDVGPEQVHQLVDRFFAEERAGRSETPQSKASQSKSGQSKNGETAESRS
jgi:GntR family transcriptional regulator